MSEISESYSPAWPTRSRPRSRRCRPIGGPSQSPCPRAGPRATSCATSSRPRACSSGFVGRSMLDDMPSVDDDPARAWNAARAVDAGRPRRPSAARPRSSKAAMGTHDASRTQSTASCASTSSCTAGTSPTRPGSTSASPPRISTHVRVQAEGFGDAMRGPQAFGPEVEPPARRRRADRSCSRSSAGTPSRARRSGAATARVRAGRAGSRASSWSGSRA